MDSNIQNSIDLRKSAIFDYYDIKKKDILSEIEELFQEMLTLGEASKDVMDFETQFASSDLNTKYLSLLEKIALSCSLKKQHKAVVYTEEEAKEDLKEAAKDELEYLGSEAYLNTRSAINRKFGITEKIRRTPILGTAWEVENQTGVIMNFKDKLKTKRREEKRVKKEAQEEAEKEFDNEE